MLPERFVILGTSRKSMSDEEFRLSIRLMLEELKGEKGLNGEEVNRFLQKVYNHKTQPRQAFLL
jgi:glucose-6-phosphate 1-dehydrogenase